MQRNIPTPEKEWKKAVFPCCLPHFINTAILEWERGSAIVSDTRDDVWVLNVSIAALDAGIKVEAVNIAQTSEQVGKVSDKRGIKVEKQ